MMLENQAMKMQGEQMRYYIINDNSIWSETTSLEKAKKDIELLIKANDYIEAQALEYIQLIKGEGLTLRVVHEASHIEIID